MISSLRLLRVWGMHNLDTPQNVDYCNKAVQVDTWYNLLYYGINMKSKSGKNTIKLCSIKNPLFSTVNFHAKCSHTVFFDIERWTLQNCFSSFLNIKQDWFYCSRVVWENTHFRTPRRLDQEQFVSDLTHLLSFFFI